MDGLAPQAAARGPADPARRSPVPVREPVTEQAALVSVAEAVAASRPAAARVRQELATGAAADPVIAAARAQRVTRVATGSSARPVERADALEPGAASPASGSPAPVERMVGPAWRAAPVGRAVWPAWREASVERAAEPDLPEAPVAVKWPQALVAALHPVSSEPVGLEAVDRRRAVPACQGLPRGAGARDDRISRPAPAAAPTRSSRCFAAPPPRKAMSAARAPE